MIIKSKSLSHSQRNRILNFFILFAILFILGGCSKKRTAIEEKRDTIEISTPEDGGEAVTEEEMVAEPVKVYFSTPQQAIKYMNESPDSARYNRGILPQMAKDELKYAIRLLNNRHDGFIVVDKARMKVIKFDKYGEEIVSYGMACARNFGTKHEKPDNRTPEGFFSVRKVHDSTDWQFVDDNGVKSEKKGEFGPRFIRLNIPGWYSIGIHGTCAPWSIGGRRSHGCIRVTNENIMQLIEMVDSGMPVIVTPGRKDMAVNLEEGYEIPSISTIPGKPAPKLSKAAEKEALANRERKKNQIDSISTSLSDSISPKKIETRVDSLFHEEPTTPVTDSLKSVNI